MPNFKTLDYKIPESMQESWQHMLNVLAEITKVPATLVMRIHPKYIEVNSSSQTEGNPYGIGDSEELGHGLYCEHVINTRKELIVPDATQDPDWDSNPDIKLGMISYCGLPLHWPNGETFGTICMLDSKENAYNDLYRKLMASFRDSVQAQLAVVFQHNKLMRMNKELKSRVDSRTVDLAQMSFSLDQEITRRKEAENQIDYQKSHDVGTDLFNRTALENSLQDILQSTEAKGARDLAVVNVGFSNAMTLQSRYGFEEFDAILKEYRDRLGIEESEYFITGRPSSNDLVFVIWGEHANDTLLKLTDAISRVGLEGFNICSDEIHLHTYTGIVQANENLDAKSLLQNASHAMLLCKESGEPFSYYCENHSNDLNQNNQLESYLLQAVRNDDLMLYFQPKVHPTTHKWIGAEALLRWRHPVLGDVSNEALIRMAEQNGLIFEVGAFVLRTAISKAKEWSALIDNFHMAINVSPIQLKSANFAEQVEHLLDTYHLPAHFLELEVTESAIIADELTARNTLTHLHKLGVKLSLDDFGTGFASFSCLKKYPFDAIKIDKSFVHQMETSDDDKAIIRSIINVAKKLDLQVVIEGIESASQEQFVVSEGCDIGQGFLYGKPMPCAEFEQGLFNQNILGDRFAYEPH